MASGSKEGGQSVAKWMEVGFGAASAQSATPKNGFFSFFFPEAEEEETFGCMQCLTKRDAGGRDAAMYRRGAHQSDAMTQRVQSGDSLSRQHIPTSAFAGPAAHSPEHANPATSEPPWIDRFASGTPSSMGLFAASGGRALRPESGVSEPPHAPAQRGSPSSFPLESSPHRRIEVRICVSFPHTGQRDTKNGFDHLSWSRIAFWTPCAVLGVAGIRPVVQIRGVDSADLRPRRGLVVAGWPAGVPRT